MDNLEDITSFERHFPELSKIFDNFEQHIDIKKYQDLKSYVSFDKMLEEEK